MPSSLTDNAWDRFGQYIDEVSQEIHEVNVANGWFDSGRTVLEGHMLLVTEVAEASEAFRDHGLADFSKESDGTVLTKPEGVGSEYADILIRLLDQCDRDGIDLAYETKRKLAFNRTRGYRHGGKSI